MAALQQPLQPTPGERDHTLRCSQALVALAREVWTPTCTLESALARICETAATTLGVDRVNVWRLHVVHGVLRCIHSYDRRSGIHNPPGYDEAFDADNDYGRRLGELRVIEAADVQGDPALAETYGGLGDYLARNGVVSLLDVPVRSEGVLLGVVCHEQVGVQRTWTDTDQAFAASIGDYVAIASEIHRRRDAERRLRYLELHDAQTNLPNRDHLLEVAHSALRPAGLEDSTTAIHVQIETTDAVGSAELVAVAAVLREALADEATLARVRDDAFALVPHRTLQETEALELAGRCIELAERAASVPGSVRASAGIAFSRDLAAPSADILLRNAELASQRARSLGRLERCEVFDAGRHRALLERMRMERALRDAHERGRLQVHYQPVVDLGTGRVQGAEALMRWHDETGECRPACDFIHVAESSGLIVPLGRWLLREACAAAASWPVEADQPPPQISVNVSARQFEQPGLVADVARALRDSGLAPERLWLELTETALLPDGPSAIRTLERLRALGVHVVLDDFGTGHSSFARLKLLPIDGLKIDRSFVSDLPSDGLDRAIVAAIAAIARQAGLSVVAEGVENEAQARVLVDCGVTAGQGFHFGRPAPAAALRGALAVAAG